MAKRSVQRVYPLETGPFRPSFFRSLLSDICRLCIYRSYDSFSSLHASIVARRCKYRLDRFRVYNARVCVYVHTRKNARVPSNLVRLYSKELLSLKIRLTPLLRPGVIALKLSRGF